MTTSFAYVAIVVVGVSYPSHHSADCRPTNHDNYAIVVSSKGSAMIDELVSVAGHKATEELIVRNANSSFGKDINRLLLNELNRINDELADQERTIAQLAIRDGATLASKISFQKTPRAGITDEGFAILQWSSDEDGLILIFAGDGSVILSIASKDKNYSESLIDYSIGGNTALVVSNAIQEMYA